jgi:hypothetical protein
MLCHCPLVTIVLGRMPSRQRGVSFQSQFGERRDDPENSGIDISQAREVIREMLGEIRVRPEPDGVPVAEYALNQTPRDGRRLCIEGACGAARRRRMATDRRQSAPCTYTHRM